MKIHPTLRSLAKKAGVHHTTFSRALRNDPRLPEATRLRLQSLARAEGYRSDALATRYMTALQRGKAGQKQEILGVLTSDTHMGEGPEPFQAFCRNISQRASELGYRIEELWTAEPGMTTSRMNKIILTRGIEGLIIPPTFAGRHTLLNLSNVASVQHSHAIWRPRLHRVEAHNFQNMLLVMRELLRRKYDRIGLMLFNEIGESTGHEWEGAYDYYHARHLRLARIPVFACRGFQDEQLLQWVKTHRPEVIVGAYPYHAEFFRKNGFRVPEDLGLISMGVHAWDPPTAGLDMRAAEIDRAAVDVVVAQINHNEKGIPSAPRDVLIEGTWHEGPTVRPLVANP